MLGTMGARRPRRAENNPMQQLYNQLEPAMRGQE